MDEQTVRDHKLCGFLLTVVKIPPPYPPNLPETLIPHTPCRLFTENNQIAFLSQTGVVLSLIDKDVTGESSTTPFAKKKLRTIGVVRGSLSVVHQLSKLVNNKCLAIRAKVTSFEIDGDNCRVVVLVDVYLPIEVWSGWQFPRIGSTAAALFRHLSCHWEARRSMIEHGKMDLEHNHSIWNVSDCHVLGCKLHCSAHDTSKKKLFELNDIFMSLPSVSLKGDNDSSRVDPVDCCKSGLWVLPDDVLLNILTILRPLELLKISATCHHLRFLAASIMPCMKLKLFPHQHAAVEWMLRRERDSEVLPHPLFMDFLTEDGFPFYVNVVSGEIISNTKPTFRDFKGGMFCDEPGLGKTITALSLILKTQGTLAAPPDGTQVIWCYHNGDQRCGYYELNAGNTVSCKVSSSKGVVSETARRGQFSLDKLSSNENLNGYSKKNKFAVDVAGLTELQPHEEVESPKAAHSTPATCVVRCTRSSSGVKKNLLHKFATASGLPTGTKTRGRPRKRKYASNGPIYNSQENARFSGNKRKRCSKVSAKHSGYNETWVQCDACKKWRRLAEANVADATTAWFCSMNSDPLHRGCNVPEESWDYRQPITNLPGFHSRESSGGTSENVSFFISVLKEHYSLITSQTKKALTWMAKLSPNKLSEMETSGLLHPVMHARAACTGVPHEFHKVFQAFGLIKREEQGTTRWYYPSNIADLVFDVAALRIALCEPFDSLRLYLSKATLVVVPSNLVDHWYTQILKHVTPGQLRVYVWTEHKKPCAHNLAWDYDVVITTFSRLSAEWSPRKRSVLMQIHWYRIIFDEGHTLGSSLNLTNKLQMSFSLTARNRWLLTGTPTPNTPNSQLSHIQPMLKFLREEVYGQNPKSWENGILRPFEAEMDDGRSRLLQLLRRCMISARKEDLQTIPPCIKKVKFLNFTEEHARSYNELVVTVRRNILMADWNDPSHVESLLNPKQWKFRSNTIRNVRLSCCVAGHIRVSEAGQDIQETMDIFAESGLDPLSVEYHFIKYNLLYGGNCMRCKEWCRLPVVTPCRHLLCLDCVALNSESCTFPGCSNSYEMQSPEVLTRPENPNPKWPVPKDLIELQPSYKQDDWHPDWQSTSSSKVTYLVCKLKELLEANRKIGYCIGDGADAKALDETIASASANYRNESYETPPEKVIIFSQFLEHIHVIEQQLMLADIKFAGMYSPMHSTNKMKSLTTFQHDPNCIALLMDGSAALGLDLSFVSHVFLMEPIWDKSMEEQVISRAHRMGATRPIHVETLAMKGTIEEQMMRFLQDADECRKLLKEEFGKHNRESARGARRTLHDFAESNYLAQLSFVRTVQKLEGIYVGT